MHTVSFHLSSNSFFFIYSLKIMPFFFSLFSTTFEFNSVASRVRPFNLELSPNTHADRDDSFLQLARLLTAQMTLSQIFCVCLTVACKNYIFPQVLQQHFYHHHVFTFTGPTGQTSIINCEINSSPAERDPVFFHRNPPVGPSSWACELWSCARSYT